jgi:hypothetical protein
MIMKHLAGFTVCVGFTLFMTQHGVGQTRIALNMPRIRKKNTEEGGDPGLTQPIPRLIRICPFLLCRPGTQF